MEFGAKNHSHRDGDVSDSHTSRAIVGVRELSWGIRTSCKRSRGVPFDVGTLRETFFLNQTRVLGDVTSSFVSDFEIGGNTFEIGGRSKGQDQLAGVQYGYVVRDDIEHGYGNVIPLWAFGLGY